jgi:hypothetical protein
MFVAMFGVSFWFRSFAVHKFLLFIFFVRSDHQNDIVLYNMEKVQEKPPIPSTTEKSTSTDPKQEGGFIE